ncbi:integrase, partial [Salmonella enterica subsp. enterica serovar Worthington str. BCH-3008]
MPLTDTAIRKIKPTEKSFKITDSSGLYLLIKPNGSKLWYMKYRIDEKEKKLAFGPMRYFMYQSFEP